MNVVRKERMRLLIAIGSVYWAVSILAGLAVSRFIRVGLYGSPAGTVTPRHRDTAGHYAAGPYASSQTIILRKS